MVERGALCILGAGIAGLNSLFAASRYLSKGDRVVLIDRQPRCGGMWNDTYSYVRLHQPHRFFTAGDIKWTLDRPPEYLATRDEVLDHLQHCVDVLRERVELVELYGHDYVSHEEVEVDGGVEVRITCKPVDGGEPVVIEADRFVKALGYQIHVNDALEVSSDAVRSVSPNHVDVLGDEMQQSDAPVYVIGGGKTGMDTALSLIDAYPDREINLVVGSGTVFSRRDDLFPTGFRRWWAGLPTLPTMMRTAERFDGTNEDEAHEYFTTTFGSTLDPRSRNFKFGLLSDLENERVASGANQVLYEYLDDVVDGDDGPELVFRGGERRAIAPDSWLINCTGYTFRGPERPYEPFVSERGAVVTVNTRSAVHFLSTYSSYLLVHLMYLDKLRELPLYELDFEQLHHVSKMAMPYVGMALSLYNAGHIIPAVPNKVMGELGVDLDRWYPLHRRLTNIVRFMWRRKKMLEHNKRSLDVVRERLGIRCGPLARA